MNSIFITADKIAEQSGGGQVTFQEAQALRGLGNCLIWDRSFLEQNYAPGLTREEPWTWDVIARANCIRHMTLYPQELHLAHFYAGTFSDTVRWFKNQGIVTSYTAAAHDVQISQEAHRVMGLAYDYPHLTNPKLWERYVQGYRECDVLIVPSTHSHDIMRKYGCTQRIEIIPHGTLIPECEPAELPTTFVMGYLGSFGADKGVIYLLQAWRKLNYADAVLVLAGKLSTHPWVQSLVREHGGGVVQLRGWVDDIQSFYDRISIYCQPSLTEGFGCEVTEALAHGRQVICSQGAGAADIVSPAWRCAAGNVEALCQSIDQAKRLHDSGSLPTPVASKEEAKPYSWDNIRARYQAVWRELCPAT